MNQTLASQQEIEKALNEWWAFYDRKKAVSQTGELGISPTLVDDDKIGGRTVKYSLAPNIAPELDGLGRLVNETRPHVYVEGVRKPDIIVPFEEILSSEESSYVFQIMPPYFKQHGIEPQYFLLYIYSHKGHFEAGRAFYKDIVKDLLFFTSKDEKFNAFTLERRELNVNLNPLRHFYKLPPSIRNVFNYSLSSDPSINPTTSNEIGIIYDSFKDARSRIS